MIVEFCLREIPNVEIRSALSGEEAIGIAIEFKPDLILLDLMMPKMDGIATLEALRLLPNSVKTPIIFMTAKAQKSEIESYIKYGVIDVIVKPFDASSLANTVLKIWEKYQQQIT